MSQCKEVNSVNQNVNDESDPAGFLFINIEENIKQEKDEEEQFEDGEVEERNYGHDSTQEYPVQDELDNDGEKSPPHGCNKQQQIDGESSVENVNNSEFNTTNNNPAFSCDKCSIAFTSPIYLEGHKNRCRARTEKYCKTASTSDTQTLPDTCDTDTPIPRRGKTRVPQGELKHKCDTCGRGFVRLSYLRAHIATHKTAFKCDECDYTTDVRRNLNRHMVVHYGEEEKKYACTQCSYTAGKSSYLRKHVAKHSEEKSYRCRFCAYVTTISSDLTEHMNTHNNQKPFACSHCYYSTSRKVQLAKHLEKYHSTPGKTDTCVALG